MKLIDELVATARVTPVRRGEMVMLCASDAMRVVDAAAERGQRVLGAEGFRLEGKTIVSDMDSILDIGEVTDLVDSVMYAKAFLQEEAAKGLMFELVLDDAAIPTYTCPVCGYPNLDEPPRCAEGGGSYGIDSGMVWRGFRAGENPPTGWDPAQQLDRLTGSGDP